jgi:hypothetical protein
MTYEWVSSNCISRAGETPMYSLSTSTPPLSHSTVQKCVYVILKNTELKDTKYNDIFYVVR